MLATNFVPLGDEFQVNTYTTFDQSNVAVAADSLGNWVAVWASRQDGSSTGIYGQRFSSSGAPLGPEFQINTYTTSAQNFPSVAVAPSGDFVVSWQSLGQDGDSYGIYARRFNANGVTLGEEFQVNTFTTGSQRRSSVAMDAAGNFIIVWDSAYQDGSNASVYAQRYLANGTPLGSEFRVNSHTLNRQDSARVAMAADGVFVVTWKSSFQDGDSYGIYAQRYLADATPFGPEFRVNTYTTGLQTKPAIAMADNGQFVITWHSLNQDGSSYGVYAQRYNPSGAAVGSEFRVNTHTPSAQLNPSIAIDAAGNFLIAWQSYGQDGSHFGIFAQRYDQSGIPRGQEFQVNTYTTSFQLGPAVAMDAQGNALIAWSSYSQDGDADGIFAQRWGVDPYQQNLSEFLINTYTTFSQGQPSIAMNAAGNAVVVWSSPDQDGSDRGVFGQRYNAFGNPVGPEFQINTFVPNDQRAARVAMDAAGNFVVVWESQNQDGSPRSIFAQRFAADGTPLGTEFQVNSYTTGTQSSPVVAMRADGDFVIAWNSNGQDGSSYGVFAQRFDAAGTPQGSEFQVNTHTTGSQASPSIGMDDEGNFAITWGSYGQVGNSDIFLQRYSADGTPLGGEVLINSYTTGTQRFPALAMGSAGNFVVAWESLGQDGSMAGVYGQRFDDAGVPIGPEFQVNTYTTSNQQSASVAMAETGDFTITWVSHFQDGSAAGVFAQRYTAQGTPIGGEFLVNTYTTSNQNSSAVAMDAQGNHFFVWQSYQDGFSSNIYGQRYGYGIRPANPEEVVVAESSSGGGNLNRPRIDRDANGNIVVVWNGDGPGDEQGVFGQLLDAQGDPQGDVFRINSHTPNNQGFAQVARNAAGDFVVVWTSFGGQDGDSSGIYAQRYHADGSPLGSEFQVNTYTTSGQTQPAVALDDEGRFIVVWASFLQDGSSFGVFGQRFDSDGSPLGTEFQVNTHTTGGQTQPTIATDANGNFVVAWSSLGQDGSGNGVFAQRYNAAGVSLAAEFQINQHTINNQETPALAMDSAGNFVVAWLSVQQDSSSGSIFARRYLADGTPASGEFAVNSYTTGSQALPAVAMDADGRFVITWRSNGQDGSGLGIFAQRFDSTGAAIGSEFQVNTFTTGDQTTPAVTLGPEGDLLIVWSSVGQVAAGGSIHAQRYSDGTAEGGEFLLSPVFGSDHQAAVANDAVGNTIIVWQRWQSGGRDLELFARRMDSVGNLIGGEFQVNSYTLGRQANASVAMNPAGQFVIAWESEGQDGSGTGIFAQRFASDGTPLGMEFQANSHTTGNQQNPTVTIDDAGNFVIAWESAGQGGPGSNIFAQRYDAAGTPLGAEFQVNTFATGLQHDAVAAIDALGNFLITWTSPDQDGDGTGVFAQRFAANGTALGTEFQINTYTTGDQTAAAVAMTRQGQFVVTWQSANQDGSDEGIFARRFASDGTPLGNEFRANTVTTGSQRNPGIAIDDSGNFLITWESALQDGSGFGIFAQRFHADGTRNDLEFQLNTLTTLDQRQPAVAMDTEGNFVVAWESVHTGGSQVLARKYHVSRPPTVADIQVRGSSWGAALPWYPVPVGSSNQLKPLPWTNIDQLRIVFSTPVVIASGDLQLLGVNVPDYAGFISGFSYDPETFTATWTFSTAFDADKLRLRLADGVVRSPFGVTLDGEWIDGTSRFFSGDGTPGGTFAFRLNILPGDVNANGSVTTADVSLARNRLFTTAGMPTFDLFADVNANGSITTADVAQARNRLFTSLPTGDPAGAMAAFGDPAGAAPSPMMQSIFLSASTELFTQATIEADAAGPEESAFLILGRTTPQPDSPFPLAATAVDRILAEDSVIPSPVEGVKESARPRDRHWAVRRVLAVDTLFLAGAH